MNKLKIFVIFLLIALPINTFSQAGVTHSIGVIAGAVQFRSDYGQRDDSKTNIGNTGFSIAFVDFMNFSYTDYTNDYFKEHFKIRNELSYSKTNLQHYGEWIKKNTLPAQQLKAMSGSTQLLSLGTQLEFSFIHIHDFESTVGSFNPYIAIGPYVSYYTARVTSELGELGNPLTTYPKYLIPSDGHAHGYANESKAVFSVALNIGTRYKLTRMSDLVFDVRAQTFSSDWVDGLNPNKDSFTENKNKDWLTSVGVGYIYYFGD